MRPLIRVAAVALVVGSLAGVAALRPTPAPRTALAASEPAAQTSAVVQARAVTARNEAVARAAALQASRLLAVRRHQALVAARAALAARQALAQAATATAPARTAVVRTPQVRTATVRTTATSGVTRAQRIYAGFHYDIGRLGYRMVFKPGAKGLLGLTDSGARTITIYVRSTESDLVLAHTIAHEMGHAVDFTRGSDAQHQLYQSIRGITRSIYDWYGCNDCTDYTTSAGDWAEVFAQWLAGPGDFRSRMAGVPSSAQLARLAPLFRL